MNASSRNDLVRSTLSLLAVLGLSVAAAGGDPLDVPPPQSPNETNCYNLEGEGCDVCGEEEEGQPATLSGAIITGNSNGAGVFTAPAHTAGAGGRVVFYDGSYRHQVVDYRMYVSGGADDCGAESPIVDTPHHAPFVLEFSRYFQSRNGNVDYGLTGGWVDNRLFRLTISSGPSWRNARLEYPYHGAAMNWIDPGIEGTWHDDTWGEQSMHLTLQDEPGDMHLVTDRWGGRYHFVPNTGRRPYLQYLMDWLEDENGNRITLTYDDGYPVEARDDFGRTVQYAWGDLFDGTLHLRRVTLPDGSRIDLRCQWTAERLKVSYPTGDVASYGIGVDADGIHYQFNDPLGRPGGRKDRVYFYENSLGQGTGRVRAVKNEAGAVKLVRLEHAGIDDLTLLHRDGRRLRYEFGQKANGESEGLERRVTDLVTGKVHVRDWELGVSLLRSETDGLGNVTSNQYDEARGLLLRTDHPDGSFESWSYDGTNRGSLRVDRNGNATQFLRDAHGNLMKKVHADGTFEEWTRDSRGAMLTWKDRNGDVTTYDYDANGNVSAITLPTSGGEPHPIIVFAHDVNGRTVSVVDPVGRSIGMEHDALGRRVKTTHPDGSAEVMVYGDMSDGTPGDPVGDAGLVVERYDRNGNVTRFEYGEDDRVERISGAPGEVILSYDAEGRRKAREENGDREWYEHDAAGRVVRRHREVDAVSTLTWENEYDLLDRVVRMTDPHGFVTETTFDPMGRMKSTRAQIDAGDFALTSVTYDGNGNVLTLTDPNGNTAAFEYDSDDRLVRRRLPPPFEQSSVTFAYDGNGNLLSRTDELGHVSSMSYTPRNRLKTATDPTGDTRVFTYYLDDNPKSVANPGTGGLESYTYTCCGRVATKTTHVDGGPNDIFESFTWDGNGNQLSRSDGEGNVTHMTYDERDRVTSRTDPLGAITESAWSDDGSRLDPRLAPGQGASVTVTDPNGVVTSTVLDGEGRTILMIDGAGEAVKTTHDRVVGTPSGPVVEMIVEDRNHHESRRQMDGLGRVVRRIDALGHATEWELDQAGRVVSITDANGHATKLVWDERDLRIAEIAADGEELTWTHHANGLEATVTDRSGDVVEYGYDAANRLVKVTYPGLGVSDQYAYDAGGRLILATSGLYGNALERAYDAADRLVSEVQDGWAVGYGRDRRSLVTRIDAPSGRSFERIYDAAGRLTRVREGDVDHLDQVHDPGGRMTDRVFGNGTTARWEYDPANRPEVIEHSAGAGVFQRFEYVYDPVGNVLFRKDPTFPGRSEKFIYDDADRLVMWLRSEVVKKAGGAAAPPPQDVQTWRLDPVENWSETDIDGVHQVRVHNEVDEVVGIDGRRLSYDDDGNLLGDSELAYEYDPLDRLKEARRARDGAPVGRYEYDALGRRVARVDEVSGLARRYIYDHDRVLEERTLTGDDVVADHVFGDSSVDLVARLSGSSLYYHADAAHSTVAVTSRSGAILERYEYDAFGGTVTYDSRWLDPRPTSRVGNPYGFAGRAQDAETGLQHYVPRYVDPALGRFTTRFKGGPAAGTNLYLHFADPGDRMFVPGPWRPLTATGDGKPDGKVRCEKQADGSYKWKPYVTPAFEAVMAREEYEPCRGAMRKMVTKHENVHLKHIVKVEGSDACTAAQEGGYYSFDDAEWTARSEKAAYDNTNKFAEQWLKLHEDHCRCPPGADRREWRENVYSKWKSCCNWMKAGAKLRDKREREWKKRYPWLFPKQGNPKK